MSLHEENRDELEPVEPLILQPSISKENLAEKTNCLTRFSGIIYALAASLVFTCAIFALGKLNVDILDALLLRFFLQTVITGIFVVYKRYTLLAGSIREIFLQIVCCGLSVGGFFVYFLAVQYINLSDLNTLCYTRVVWTVVLSVIVYRERPSKGTLIALPLTLLGVVFVTQPNFIFPSKIPTVNKVSNQFRLVGFAMALGFAVTSAINVLLFKQLISASKDIKPSILTLQFTGGVLFALIINQLYKIFYIKTITSFSYIFTSRYLLSSIVCVFMILGSVLSQQAIKREHPAVFSLLGSADIIFALLLQNIFTSVRSNLYALIGSGLVILSVVVIGITRIIDERRAEEKIKREQIENINENHNEC